jgi:outer membrane protein assembly factor BamB
VTTDDSGREYLVFSSLVYGISAVDPKDGSILWEQPGFSVRALTSPVLAENLIIATCGSGASGKTLMAVRPASKAKPAAVAYKIEDRTVPFVPCAIIANGLLFTFHDQGQVVCRDAQTGTEKWAEKPGGRFFGSPICVENRLYCMNIDGDVIVLKAAEKYELLAVNPLGEKTHATPAVAGGILYLRTLTKVFAVAEGEELKH